MQLRALWEQLKEQFAKIPKKSRKRLAILSGVVVALAIIITVFLTRTNWVVLPVPGDNVPQVYTALLEMNVPVRVNGNILEVPEQRLGDVRMRLREQGLLGAAEFDRGAYMADATGFGITDAHARRQYDFQLGADIRTALLQIPYIHNALVLVSSGETSPFRIARNINPATASVQLTLRGRVLTQSEAQAIAELVRASVPGILYENISITDDALIHYRIGDNVADVDTRVGQRIALQNVLAEQMKTQVEILLSPVFGMSNMQVQPYVRLNFDDMVTESVEFAPPIPGNEEGLVRSFEEIHEISRRMPLAEGIPGTDANALGSVEYPWGTLDDGLEYRRHVLGQNYELNETRTRIEHEQGVIEAVSIGILINSEIEGIEDDYTEQLTHLIANAIGVPMSNVSIQYAPFNYIDTTMIEMFERMEAEQAAQRRRELIEMFTMYGVILLLGVMVFLLIRTGINAFKKPEPELAFAGGPGEFDIEMQEEEEHPEEYEEIDINQKSPGLEQIERFIDKDSAAVAGLLRNWLTDE